MRANTKEDKKMKIGLIDDVLTIVDIEQMYLFLLSIV